MERVRGIVSQSKVALVDFHGWHDEVKGALVHILTEMNLNLTRHINQPMRFGFDAIMDSFSGEWESELKGDIVPQILAGEVDLIIFTTCDAKDLKLVTPALLSMPLVRAACVIHHADGLTDVRDISVPLAITGQLTFVGLSGHVSNFVQRELQSWAKFDLQTMWNNVDVLTIIPTFPPTNSQDWTIERRRYNRWVVQGNLDTERRSYNQLFADMLEYIEEDPASWGLTKPKGEIQFVPIEGADNSISLHVIGKRMTGREPTIPPELEGIIEIYENLNFTAFYDLLHSMDVMIPAFNIEHYLESRASSTMAAGLIAVVPILASTREIAAYTHLTSPAVLEYPTGMSEIEALKMIRAGIDPMDTVKRLSRQRVSVPWEQWKEELMGQNMEVIAQMLSIWPSSGAVRQ